ncbi:hypothetical protein SUNI508_13955 [Seiridium unicorne]|uniref:Uncharacterized protein n=1 Tax=Seiridium unicorne TaxID=138068 RepID=A0ABR2VA30_9PEZI
MVKVMSGALRFSAYQVEITKSFPICVRTVLLDPKPVIDSRTNKNQRTTPEEGSICRVDGMAHRTATFPGFCHVYQGGMVRRISARRPLPDWQNQPHDAEVLTRLVGESTTYLSMVQH